MADLQSVEKTVDFYNQTETSASSDECQYVSFLLADESMESLF